jgi:hypothetical protein
VQLATLTDASVTALRSGHIFARMTTAFRS